MPTNNVVWIPEGRRARAWDLREAGANDGIGGRGRDPVDF
ncbi:Hypothetical protein A7982_00463 [Minicystis rosea]|nr:Hypothetical protein A7982_00463 [Minicystis rosea]